MESEILEILLLFRLLIGRLRSSSSGTMHYNHPFFCLLQSYASFFVNRFSELTFETLIRSTKSIIEALSCFEK